MDYDTYGEVINGPATYKTIAYRLSIGQSVLIGWTDQAYDHRDIMFIFNTELSDGYYSIRKFGDNIQRGMRWSNLFVGIIAGPLYGFIVENQRHNEKHPEYIKEHLMLLDNKTNDKICELINGVIHELDILRGDNNE